MGCAPSYQTKPSNSSLTMSENLMDSKQKEALLNDNLDSVEEFNTGQDMMEEKNDMFVSALDSPTDSGLAGLETLDNSTNETEEEENITHSDNTMEDLSLQDDIEMPVEAVGDEK